MHSDHTFEGGTIAIGGLIRRRNDPPEEPTADGALYEFISNRPYDQENATPALTQYAEEVAMGTDTQLEKQTNQIADAIVDLVERTNGPVTLAQVEREIEGFHRDEPPFWRHVVTYAGGEASLWDEMTEAGLAALQKVTIERRVTVQFVSILPYILEGGFLGYGGWRPIVLLPSRAANVDSRNWLIRVPQSVQDCIFREAAERKTNLRPLKSHYAGATADRFFSVDNDLLF